MIDTSMDEFLAKNSLRESRDADTRWPLTHTGYEFDHRPMTISKTKPLILTYKSELLETVDTLFYLPLYLFGWKKQKEVIGTQLMDWPPKMRANSTFAIVEIDRRVNINKAYLVWDVKWWGFRYFMFRYRITSFVIGTLTFWAIENIFMVSVAFAVFRTFRIAPEDPPTAKAPRPQRAPQEPEKTPEALVTAKIEQADKAPPLAGTETSTTADSEIGPLTPAATPLPLIEEEEGLDEDLDIDTDIGATRRRPFHVEEEDL